MNFALDIICVVIFLWAVIASWRKGFIKAALGLVSVIVSFLLAKAFTPALAGWIDEKFMNGKIALMFENFLSSNEQLAKAGETITGFFDSIKQAVPGGASDGIVSSGEEQISSITSTIAGTISYSLSEIAAFIILFVVILIICKIAIVIINAIFSLPLLGMINHGLGFVFGFVKGALFVFLLCLLVSFVIMMTASGENPAITFDIVDDTYIFKHFYYNNIIAGFLF